jgi:hypothetical protein
VTEGSSSKSSALAIARTLFSILAAQDLDLEFEEQRARGVEALEVGVDRAPFDLLGPLAVDDVVLEERVDELRDLAAGELRGGRDGGRDPARRERHAEQDAQPCGPGSSSRSAHPHTLAEARAAALAGRRKRRPGPVR